MSEPPVTPELLLQAYTAGYFPMARSGRGRKLYWFNPDIRGALPLDEPDTFHLPRSLAKFLRRCDWRITVDAAFAEVIRACADSRREGREETWINADIIGLYTDLHGMGFAHSVEVWEEKSSACSVIPAQAGILSTVGEDSRFRGNDEKETRSADRASPEHGEADSPFERQHVAQRGETNTPHQRTLVGGLYGVSIGGAFFGESMFSTRSNASKCALAHLVRRLRAAGYTLLDAQFENAHLTQFGFRAMPREDYLAALRKALSISPNPSSRFLTVSVSNV